MLTPEHLTAYLIAAGIPLGEVETTENAAVVRWPWADMLMRLTYHPGRGYSVVVECRRGEYMRPRIATRHHPTESGAIKAAVGIGPHVFRLARKPG